MKNLFKLFFIVSIFLFSLSLNPQGETVYADSGDILPEIAAESLVMPPADVSVKIINQSEKVIVSSNNTNHEISSINNDRKDSGRNGLSCKYSIQDKLLRYFLISKYNQLYHISFHKISPYLKNEICTRAP